MIASIILSVYLLIGLFYSHYAFRYVEEVAEKEEKGEKLNKIDEELLEVVKDTISLMGGKTYVPFFYIVTTIFWLPMIVLPSPKNKGK